MQADDFAWQLVQCCQRTTARSQDIADPASVSCASWSGAGYGSVEWTDVTCGSSDGTRAAAAASLRAVNLNANRPAAGRL